MQPCEMSEIVKAEIWERRQRGETYAVISAAVGASGQAIYTVIKEWGGIPPRPRRRAARTLTEADREEISRGIAAQASFAAIGRRLQRPTSTISREVRRHGGRLGYRAAVANRAAWHRARRPKRCRLAQHPRLRAIVAAALTRDWSPQQIAAWLRRHYPDNPEMQVSHETIYRSLFVQARGVLKRDLMRHLRRARPLRRPRQRSALTHTRIADLVSISQRPAEVADRAVPGHWEGDLLRGARQSHIATLVERHSRFVMLVRTPDVDAPSVARALARHIRQLPPQLRRSLTWDRGTEMAAHRQFTIATNVQVYFCDPQSPWQRGSNENTNGLLRQYFPDGTDLRSFNQAQLNRIAARLNTRPRQTLGWDTPADRLAAAVASTA
jgi:IS30 family transposase